MVFLVKQWLCRTRIVDPMLIQCWPSVFDAGPTLNQHRVSYTRVFCVGSVGERPVKKEYFVPRHSHRIMYNTQDFDDAESQPVADTIICSICSWLQTVHAQQHQPQQHINHSNTYTCFRHMIMYSTDAEH